MESKENFSTIIAALRASANLSQEKFGELFGVKKSTISGWESGLSTPTIGVLLKIAKYFRVTTDFLLGNEEPNKIDVDALTDDQVDLIHRIIREFKDKNDG